MEQSILTSAKKVLGIQPNYTPFDLDITMYVNAALSSMNQLGVGPPVCVAIEDASTIWADLGLPVNQLSMAKAYIFLKTRMLFDPPTTRFTIEAATKQLEEYEWRLSALREDTLPIPAPPEDEDENELEGWFDVNFG